MHSSPFTAAVVIIRVIKSRRMRWESSTHVEEDKYVTIF